jgi:hypothetical protein
MIPQPDRANSVSLDTVTKEFGFLAVIGVIYFISFHAHNTITLLKLPDAARGWKEVMQALSMPVFVAVAVRRDSRWGIVAAILYSVLAMASLLSFNERAFLFSLSGFLMIFGNAGVAVMFLAALQSQQGRAVVLGLTLMLAMATAFWLPREEPLGLTTLFLKTTEVEKGIIWTRDTFLRTRFPFDSPLNASQACWFMAVLLFWLGAYHCRTSVSRWVVMVSALGLLVSSPFTYTRAGLVLSIVSAASGLGVATLSGRRVFPIYFSGGIVAVLLGVYLLFEPTAYQRVAGLISTFADPTETGNAERIWAIQSELRDLDRIPAAGYGLDFLTPRSEWDVLINYEKTLLNVIGAIGYAGWILSLVYVGFFSFGMVRAFNLIRTGRELEWSWLCIATAPNWLWYSFVFPCFRGRMSGL